MKRLIIIGAGGFGAEALWLANEMKEWHCIGFADDDSRKQDTVVEDLPVLDDVRQAHLLAEGAVWFHCAIGDNRARKVAFERAVQRRWQPATLIHRSVIVAPTAHIGEGSYLGPGAIVCPRSYVGKGVVINTHVSVGHHSIVEDFSQASPGTRINGNCKVGELAFLGSNVSLRPGVSVGENARVASNSFAVRNIPPDASVIGIPAKAYT